MTRNQLYFFLLSISIGGYIWLGWNIYSNRLGYNNLTVCFFKNVTGLPCASCGATRSLLLVLKGELSNAIHTNPLGIILGIFLAFIPVWIVYDLVTTKESFYTFYLRSEFTLRKKWIATGSIALIMINWIWNIYKNN